MTFQGAQEWVPATRSTAKLADAAEACRGCDLWEDATQVVFSRGPTTARLVLVGEQPGDQEDLAGAPFVGPAGRVLVDALEAAGIEKNDVYVTNAVKHFRHQVRGKRRIHEKPSIAHVEARRSCPAGRHHDTSVGAAQAAGQGGLARGLRRIRR